MRPRTRLFLVPVALATGVGGCTVGPDYRRPATAVSEAWHAPVAPGDFDAAWWSRFGDPLLSELVQSAIAGNKDLAEAEARLSEARANRDAVRGRAAPQAGAAAAATRNRLSENGPLPVGRVPGLGRNLSIFDAGFDASWEIDLWGGTRRAIEGAEARAEAAQEARRGVVIQVIAEVVRSYIDLRAAQNLRANAIADAEAHARIADLVAHRARVGAAARADLLRAKSQAQAASAAVPAFEAEAAAAAFRLALLLGKPPEALYARLQVAAPLPSVDAPPAVGLRSDLLRRRPDIRHAERDLAAATADVGVATAELFPKLSLLGGIGLQARDAGDLLSGDSLRFQVGPGLRWPIFSAGRIRAQVRAADARSEAALARYERAVLTALTDSETALNRHAAAVRTRAVREDARSTAAEAVELVTRRYRAGEDDLTTLLQTQLAYSAADRSHVQAQAAELQQRVALYKALGGGWQAFEATPQP